VLARNQGTNPLERFKEKNGAGCAEKQGAKWRQPLATRRVCKNGKGKFRIVA